MKSKSIRGLINSFHVTGLFLYSLKPDSFWWFQLLWKEASGIKWVAIILFRRWLFKRFQTLVIQKKKIWVLLMIIFENILNKIILIVRKCLFGHEKFIIFIFIIKIYNFIWIWKPWSKVAFISVQKNLTNFTDTRKTSWNSRETLAKLLC